MSRDMAMLKKRARELKPLVRIGKKGVTQGTILEIKRHLETKELIKIKVLRNKKEEFQNILETILKETNAKLVSKVGFTFVLYKPRKKG